MNERVAAISVRPPPAFAPLWMPSRWKVFWGGRGSGKTQNFAETLVCRAYEWPIRVLCTREFQTSIRESVHSALKGAINRLGMQPYFRVTERSIVSDVGAEFIFDGLHHNADQIKSLNEVDIAWVEEAHSTADESWKYLIPTIRSEGRFPWLPTSEIWVSYNQHDEGDPTHQRFVVNGAKLGDRAIVRAVSWEDNPYFPKVLDDERRYMLETDPDAYDWVWGLECRKIGTAVVLSGHYVVEEFEDPHGVRPRYGMDFGFGDPNALTRCYITEERDGDHLWISHESYGMEVGLDDLPAFMEGGTSADGTRAWEGMPGVRDWPIYADNARPETIHWLRGKNFKVRAATKWPGSVEDGVAHIKRYRRIHIHQRCKNTAREARLWSHKVDRKTGDILPLLAPKHDHTWDSVRYALDGEIQSAGGLGVWAKLGQQSRRAGGRRR